MLSLSVPLMELAEGTSLLILIVFALVNLSLFLIGRRPDAPERLRRWRLPGLLGAVATLALILAELAA